MTLFLGAVETYEVVACTLPAGVVLAVVGILAYWVKKRTESHPE